SNPSKADFKLLKDPPRLSSISSRILAAAPSELANSSENIPTVSDPASTNAAQPDTASAPKIVSRVASFCWFDIPSSPPSSSPITSGMDFIFPSASNTSIPSSFINSDAPLEGDERFNNHLFIMLPTCPPWIPASLKVLLDSALSAMATPLLDATGPTY